MNLLVSIILFALVLLPRFTVAQNTDSTRTNANLFDNMKSNVGNLDTLTVADSLLSVDSTKVSVKPDSLVPIRVNGFYMKNDIKIGTNKNQIDKSDYRYAGNIFSNLPFGFLQDLGSLGQPSEVTIYGLGFGNISFLSNGAPLNNRLLNSFDLNLFRSESIDTIEILPITKGFLYSLNNNSVAVNFITLDKVSDIPYSRIRYYQGANKEGYIDGIFNLHIFPKINLAVNFTNSSINSNYANSEYSGWKVSSVLKYMPSNKINVIGEYHYVKFVAGLNGGADFQKITTENIPSEVNNILYDPFQSPVKYGEQLQDSPRYQKTTGHNLQLNILAHLVKSMPTNINLYYQFNQVEFRQNEKKKNSDIPFIFHNNTFYSAGGIFRQMLNTKWFSSDLIGTYDQTKYDSPLLKYNDTKHTASVAGSLKFLLVNNAIVPSFFAKYLNYSGNSYEGIGAGVGFTLWSNLNLDFSASRFSKPYSILEEQYLSTDNNKQNITASQINLKFENSLFNGSIGYFYYNNDASPLPVIDEYTDSLNVAEIGFYKTEKIIRQGINLNLNTTFFNILIFTNTSYYFGNNNYKNVPDFSLTGGVYYVDTLFKSNLKLKTGITIYYQGKQNYFQYDFEQSSSVQYLKPFGSATTQLISGAGTEASVQLDYFLAGEIKDAAIVYFVFENVLGAQYYIAPYYPKQSRGIRFGISWEFEN